MSDDEDDCGYKGDDLNCADAHAALYNKRLF
jgi:hypothetical protein